MTAGARPEVVAIGGGHGLAQALAALRTLGLAPTAVVTVADDGGSSGRLREDLGIIAPGDLRMALHALARNRALADVLQLRFPRGELAGHALGNLLLVALSEHLDGDFVTALRTAGELLDCAGQVLPSTTEPVQLHASVAGRQLVGQVRVQSAGEPIERVWLDPEPEATPAALKALATAEVILLGPGSLYTSIIANLLVPGVREAVIAADAPLVYVANLRTQEGETESLDLAAHIDALTAHVGGLYVDVVVVHDGPVADAPGTPLGPDLVHGQVGRLLRADLAEREPDGSVGWGHDAMRLGAALRSLLLEA